MLKYKADQITFCIEGIKVGGDVGENPTVMIGSIFYKGDKIILDEEKGSFNRGKAEELISAVEKLSDRTGLPAMFDVVFSSPIVVEDYLEFVADTTKLPILIDAVSDEVALKALEHAKKLQIIDRTVFNSITPYTKKSIYEKIREVGLEAAVILTFSTKALISSVERVKLLDVLIPKLKKAGIKKILVDTVVMDISTLGLACKAIYNVKDRFGYPAGCGAHNAVESWKPVKNKRDKLLTLASSACVNCLPVSIGADFILYGPINSAKYIFPAISIIDASYGQIIMEEGRRPDPNHPRFKIARF